MGQWSLGKKDGSTDVNHWLTSRKQETPEQATARLTQERFGNVVDQREVHGLVADKGSKESLSPEADVVMGRDPRANMDKETQRIARAYRTWVNAPKPSGALTKEQAEAIAKAKIDAMEETNARTARVLPHAPATQGAVIEVDKFLFMTRKAVDDNRFFVAL